MPDTMGRNGSHARGRNAGGSSQGRTSWAGTREVTTALNPTGKLIRQEYLKSKVEAYSMHRNIAEKSEVCNVALNSFYLQPAKYLAYKTFALKYFISNRTKHTNLT